MDSLSKRWFELRSYVGFTDGDAARLARFRSIARPHFPRIADEFYALVRCHEGAQSVLHDESQVQRLRASLQVWLDELLGGPYDDAYVARRARIGRVHVQVGLEPPYMIAAIGRVRESLQRVAAGALLHDAGACEATSQAIAHVCDLDLALTLDGYKDDIVHGLQRAHDREDDRLRRQLDAPQQLLSDALDAANVVVLGFDRNARLVVANRRAAELTGYAFEEHPDGDVFARLFGDRAEATRARWLEAKDGAPVEVEAPIRSRSGKTQTFRWSASAGRSVKEGGLSVIVVGVDLTHERALERLALQNERLAATGALAAGLAHEIRNPLNGASLHLSVLDRNLGRSPDVAQVAREATHVLRAELNRLGALVTDFLEVARPGPLARAEFDVNEVVRSAVAVFASEVEAGAGTLAVEPSPFPAMAEIDIERMQQAIVNLVRNGLEAAGKGGRVIVRVRRMPRHVEIEVGDDGAGIPDPSAPIFDPFYTTKERGTGLGLSVVHRIVSDHGGDVRFESRRGSTVFVVRIPSSQGLSSS